MKKIYGSVVSIGSRIIEMEVYFNFDDDSVQFSRLLKYPKSTCNPNFNVVVLIDKMDVYKTYSLAVDQTTNCYVNGFEGGKFPKKYSK